MALTRRQKEVLDLIAAFVADHGYCPSYEEIARGLGLGSLATVHKHISALERKHYLRRGFNQSRSLEVTPKYVQEQRKHRPAAAALEIPLMGRIAAGVPVEAVAGRERLDLGSFAGQENLFALEVRGDSMIDEHILSGDLVLVQSAPEVRDGELVVALVRGSETTLKRFYREPGDMARLQPANAQMPPLRVPLAEVQIQGRVLAVLRKYK
ncbi:MAG: transcriptional repressor LexA [Acidobacteria bacterium]|nr:transcriptional repressor LexA [Acidobacteriota bacterium]